MIKHLKMMDQLEAGCHCHHSNTMSSSHLVQQSSAAVLSKSDLHMGMRHSLIKQTFPRLIWSGGGSCKPMSWLIICLVILLCSPLTLSQSETCDLDSDCQPPADDLVNIEDYPAYRSIEVSSTCGTNGTTTTYWMVPSVLTFDEFYCNDTNPHPAEYMVDRNPLSFDGIDLENPLVTTYWQSENTIADEGDIPEEEFVIFNMTTPFLIRKLRIIFAAPEYYDSLGVADVVDMRPNALVIEIKPDSDSDWVPLRYYAEDCEAMFPGIQVQTSTALPATTAACVENYYHEDETTYTEWDDGLQEVLFNPSLEYGAEFNEDFTIQTRFIGSAVRIRLTEPGYLEPYASYYAISDFFVEGQCACYGHSDTCTGDNNDECLCQHFTTGVHCEQCMPLYNNRPWLVGANGFANACEDCDCNGHASSCYYDDLKGYGICEDCTDRTTGDKCQFCTQQYYVNPALQGNNTAPTGDCSGFNGTAEVTYPCDDYCIPCNCSLVGSDINEDYNCENATGQCYCKKYVTGRPCDECMDEYWNLDESNPDGCTACVCEISGTVNNTQLCDKDTGICICKANTYGPECDTCKDTFYSLSASNPDGCSPCGCDPGGSTSCSCPTSGGQCSCREQLSGRTCRNPSYGYYVPLLDYLTFDAEYLPGINEYTKIEVPGSESEDATVTGHGYIELPDSTILNMQIRVPSNQSYQVVIRYRSADIWPTAAILVTADNPPDGAEFICNEQSVSLATPISVGAELPVDTQGAVAMGSACLEGGVDYQFQLNIGSSGGTGILELDSVVLIPELSLNACYLNATPDAQAWVDACYEAAIPVDYVTRNNLSCAEMEYSIMAQVYDGAKSCSCNSTGSLSSLCDPYGGHCSCKPGVMLQDCSECMVYHYGFGATGCTACDCDEDGSVTLACNSTGQCECKVNVTGSKCDQCIEQHYGLYTGEGCVPCQCDADYALNNDCLDSGQCDCLDGVGGLTCFECLDMYYNLTATGCTPCDCDPAGSVNLTCNKDDGVCECKEAVQPNGRCDECMEGYYALGDWTPDGCLQCFCSGHSSNCTSASGYYLDSAENTWSLLLGDTALEDFWTGIDGDGNPVVVEHQSKFDGSIYAQFVMEVTNEGDILPLQDVYYVATDLYCGNKQSAYAMTLQFTLAIYVPIPDNYTAENYTWDYMSGLDGDVIMKGKYTDYKLVAELPYPPTTNLTTYSFHMLGVYWRVDSMVTGVAATYEEMLETLGRLEYLHIRAKYTNVTGSQTDLYNVKLDYSTQVPSTTPVNNVEQCQCPDEYYGQFCEYCSAGFTRIIPNGGPFVDCVPCECNNHGTGDWICDPETGVCNCTHQTMGDHCELCADGYFGDPTQGTPNDCSTCMCPGNMIRGDINVFAATCELLIDGTQSCINCSEGHGGYACEYCLEGYYGTPEDPENYGGQCVPCFCNGLADTCNTTTGECIDCINNTAGHNCEICAPTFFGAALQNDCKPCDCSGIGATGFCDDLTGACECKPNVEGYFCDKCIANDVINSYNISSGVGCLDCGCNPNGSLGPECNVTSGECTCRIHVLGRACDLCEDTYWNVNRITGCDLCDCTETGTLNTPGEVFGTCDVTTGQCECKLPGIIGQTCDHCAKGTTEDFVYVEGIYIGEYPDCGLCGECFDNWAFKIDEVALDMDAQNDIVMEVWSFYNNLTAADVIPQLNETAEQLIAVEDSIANLVQLVQQIEYIGENFNNITTLAYNDSLTLSQIDSWREAVQENLTDLQSFSGNILLGDGRIVTPLSLRTKAEGDSTTLNSLYTSLNTSWNNILAMNEAITSSSTLLLSLATRVDNAMADISSAQNYKLAADQVLDEGFPSLVNDSATLDEIVQILENYPSTISSIGNDLYQAGVLIVQGNTSAIANDQILNNRAAEMLNNVVVAEQSKTNATQVLAAAQATSQVVNSYYLLAFYTKGNMTSYLEDVVNGIADMYNITSQLELFDSELEAIEGVTLRDLSEMQDLTNLITSTGISTAEVSAALQAANEGLAISETAINVTALAVEETLVAQSLIQAIEADLQVAMMTRNDAYGQLADINQQNASVQGIIADVEAKALYAAQTSASLLSSAGTLEMTIADINECLDDREVRAQAAHVQALSALTEIQTAAAVDTTNDENVLDLEASVTAAQLVINSQYANLQDIEGMLQSISDDIGDIGDVDEVKALLAEFENQQIAMEELDNSIDALIGETQALLSSVTGLDPDDVTCIHV